MIFVTGSNGLIGSYIIRTFLSKGKKIKALKRKDSDLSLVADIKEQIEWVDGDILDVPVLTEAVKGAEAIIHTAALVSYLPEDKDQLFKVNVEGTANVVNAALAMGVPYLCHISSVAAIIKEKNQFIVTETTAPSEPEFSTTYGKTKYLAELEVYRGIEEGLNAFLVNPTVVLGPGNPEKSSCQLFKYVYNEGIFYTPGKLNYIDVRDVSELVFQLMEQKERINGEKFILNAGDIDYKEFFLMIADNFEVKPPYISANPWIKQLAWRGEWFRSLFARHKPLITKETAALTKNEYYYDNQKIQQLTGYNFKPVKETINWTCKLLLSSLSERKRSKKK